jgi:hypothetical protein
LWRRFSAVILWDIVPVLLRTRKKSNTNEKSLHQTSLYEKTDMKSECTRFNFFPSFHIRGYHIANFKLLTYILRVLLDQSNVSHKWNISR